MKETFTLFASFIKEYYDLRHRYPYETILKKRSENFSFDFSSLAIFKIKKDHLYSYIKEMVNFLKNNYHTIQDDIEKLALLHYLFDELDLFIVNKSSQNKNELFIDSEMFVNTVKYWKDTKVKPVSSFSKSFTTFGILDKGFPIMNINLDDLISEIGNGDEPFRRRNNLSVGIFPLSKHFLVNFTITKTLNPDRNTLGFISQSRFSEAHKNDLLEAIEIIKNDNLDIACFPELLICEDSYHILDSEIKSLKKDFFILLAGSFHRKKNDSEVGYLNSVPVILYTKGQSRVFTYNKLEPFSIDSTKASSELFNNISKYLNKEDKRIFHLMEDIVPDTSCLVLSCRKFGNFGVVICKDFLTDDSKIMANYRKVLDHLFVISLNINPSADFIPRADHLLMEHGIASFYVNAYSFDNSNKSPSFYLIPPKSEVTFKKFIPSESSYLIAKIQERLY